MCGQVRMQAPTQMSHEDWIREQGLDPVIAQTIQLHHEKQSFKSKVIPDDSPALKVMLRHRWQCVLGNRLFYQKIVIQQGQANSTICVAKGFPEARLTSLP